MTILYVILLLALAVAPLYIAWTRGDRILTRLEARRRRKRLLARLRQTRRLPVRKEDVDRLLQGESRLHSIEERIAQALHRLAELPLPSAPGQRDPAAMAAGLEAPILQRESVFSGYLDAACAQSEALEVMVREVDLLRQVARMPDSWPDAAAAPRQASDRPAAPGQPLRTEPAAREPSPTPAAEKLMNSLRDAARKRQDVDRRLSALGGGPPEPSGNPPGTGRSFIA